MSRGVNQVNPKTQVVDNCQDLYLRQLVGYVSSVIGDVTLIPPPGGGGDGTIVGSANQAATDASNALLLANNALTAANGINIDIFSGSAPSTRPDGSALASGDLWYQTSSGDINAIYQWSGSAWTSLPLTSGVFAYIDAGKITTGTLSSINIVGNYIETQLGVGTGTSPSIITGTLMNTSGQIFSYTNTGLFFGVDPIAGSVTLQSSTGTSYVLISSSLGSEIQFTTPAGTSTIFNDTSSRLTLSGSGGLDLGGGSGGITIGSPVASIPAASGGAGPYYLQAQSGLTAPLLAAGKTLVTTDASGNATISHGLGTTPVCVLATGNDSAYFIRSFNNTGTTFDVTVKNGSGLVASTNVTVNWVAFVI